MVSAAQREQVPAVTHDQDARDYRLPLSSLLEDMPRPLRDVVITDLARDSRQVVAGGAFLACQGRTTHGLAHLAAALERGAVAVLWEPTPGVEAPVVPSQVLAYPVPDLGARTGELADRFFRRPSADLQVAGITGTNGKTTTAYLLAQAADAVGRRGAYLGTLGYGRPGRLAAAELTTPDAVSVHRRLAEARDAGAVMFAMEVSSHALDQRRVGGVRFDTVVFTNLSRDHLDYHGSLEAYGAAKAQLFQAAGLRSAVVNALDPFGRRLAESLAHDVEAVWFSTASELIAPPHAGWIRLSEMRALATGLTLHVESSWGAGTLRSKLVGAFNAENLLATLGVLLGWRVPLQQALVAVAACHAPPGRMEVFGGGSHPVAVIDYAHTPDALAKLLDAARAHARGRLICVFGCGGDRDPGKRPLMGGIAEDLADSVVLTNDNPRTEEPRAIIEQIAAGMRERARAIVMPDRADAIRHALAEAEAGDVVVVAGKGHEEYQLIGHERRPFSDRAVVLKALGAAP
jgi:UDP-N-acetylmuramoyl-L-alanyl-D-glutamate--2,6-diaminopimelate ligase